MKKYEYKTFTLRVITNKKKHICNDEMEFEEEIKKYIDNGWEISDIDISKHHDNSRIISIKLQKLIKK